MRLMSPNCIVHCRTSFPQFKKAVDDIRQKQTISVSVLQALEKQCCRCNQPEEESFDLNSLEELIDRLNLTEQRKPEYNRSLPHDYLLLLFPSSYAQSERDRIIGLFIGKKGRNIHKLQSDLHLRINIITDKSEKLLRDYVNQLKGKMVGKFDRNSLWILFTLNNKEDNRSHLINQAKLKLATRWKSLFEFRQIKNKEFRKRTRPPEFESDTRWKPIKYRNRK